jgi:hypothetical protein
MTYAVATDVTNRLGRDVSDNTALITLITTRLADVERLLIRRITNLVAQLGASPPTLDVNDVIQVEADAVLRLARNPEGYVSETDGNYTYQLAQDMSAGALAILPEEWEILGVTDGGPFLIAPNIPVYGRPLACTLPPGVEITGWGWGWGGPWDY